VRTAKRVIVEAGPYTEMFDALDATAAQPHRAAVLQNVYPMDAEEGEGLVGRPGYQQLGARSPAGSVSGQGVHQFTTLAGTEFTIRVSGGRFETLDWNTRTWTEVLSASDLVGASITLSATARVSFVTFANSLIVSDGVNTPWRWDGTSHGGLTKLTNAPVFYGPPTVYSAKLFGIKASDRSKFVWSEENDPTTGYEAIGFANVWQIGQTDQNALTAIRGTNAALYYWRERSTGAVYGRVNAQFVTTATHDALSTSVGTKSPWGLVSHGEGFVFPDADGRPHRLVPGVGVVPIWAPFRETLKTIPRANLVDALAIDYPAARLLLIGYTETLQANPSAWLVYRDSPQGFVAAGVWRGFVSTQAGMVKDLSGVPTWLHQSADGYTYDHGNPDGSLWDDNANSGTVAIQHVVQGMPMGADPPGDTQFERLDLFTRNDGTMTLGVDYTTPRGDAPTLFLTVSRSANQSATFDTIVLDTTRLSGGAIEVHSSVGWNAVGRWIQPRMTHAAVGEQFGFLKWRVSGVPAGDSPFIP
jgi:hypothetical protein